MEEPRETNASRILVALGGVAIVGAALWAGGALDREGLGEESSAGDGPGGAKLVGVGRSLGEENGGAAAGALGIPRGVLRGFVRDLEGAPISGAQVCARATSAYLPSSLTARARCTKSATDGSYRLGELPAVGLLVSASAPSFIPGAYRPPGASPLVRPRAGAERLGVDIVLEGGGVEIRGVVRDLSGGEVEGAELRSGEAYATSDEEGRFSLWVRPGDARVRALAEGYSGGSTVGAAPGHLFEVYLTPEAVLVGTVVRAGDGAPLSGALVSVGGGGEGVLSDGRGAFRISGLAPGNYKAIAIADDARGEAEARTLLSFGETSEPILIKAHPAVLVEGAIVTEEGSSCEIGSVILRDRSQQLGLGGEVEADGGVRVRGALPGEYTVQVRCDGYVSKDTYPALTVAKESITGQRWEVSRGLAIRGELVGQPGRAWNELTILALREVSAEEVRLGQRRASAIPRVDGSFSLEGLVSGDYSLSVTVWGVPQENVDPQIISVAEADVEGVRIELSAVGGLRGRVIDSGGAAVSGVRVNAATVERAQVGAPPSVSVCDDGSFFLPSLAPGSYRVTPRRDWMVLPSAGAGDVGATVEIVAGEIVEVELVVGAVDGKIQGQVLDEEGSPVADVFLSAKLEPGGDNGSMLAMARWQDPSDVPVLSDEEGRFAFEGLPEGTHTIIARRQSGGEAYLEGVEPGSDVVLQITSTASLEGRVTFAGGGAPERFRVHLFNREAGLDRIDRFFRTDGHFSFEELPAGHYKVSVASAVGDAETSVDVSPGEAADELRVELAPRVKVRGQVVDEEGEPAPGIHVSIQQGYNGTQSFSITDTGDSSKRFITDEAGRFELDRAPSGAVTITLSPSGASQGVFGYSAIPAVIGAEAAVADLGTLSIVRERVPAGGIRGVLGYSLRPSPPDVEARDDRLIIGKVYPGGPAAELVPGDEIISVDGRPVAPPNRHLYHSLTTVPAGTTIKLGLARGVTVSVLTDEPR